MYVRSWSSPAAQGSVGRPSFVADHGLWDDARTAAAERIEASLADIDLVRLVFATRTDWPAPRPSPPRRFAPCCATA